MLTDDDLDPKSKRQKPRKLDYFSVPELHDYIASLEEEIARAKADIAKKEKSRAAADAIFKS